MKSKHTNRSVAISVRRTRALKMAGLSAVLCICSLAPQARAADGRDWEWMVAPYGWLPSISTDLERTVPPAGGASTDTSFDELIDKIDGVFLIYAEGQNEHWGVFADFIFLGVADGRDLPRFHTESDLDARLFELAGVWSPGEGRYRGFEAFAGLRYIDMDLDVRFDPENPQFDTTTFNASKGFNDLMIGARYTWALSDRWGLTLRGDGSFGDTEGTWNASALVQYRMKRGAWLFGYRHLAIELDTGDSNTELSMSGPVVGYAFIF